MKKENTLNFICRDEETAIDIESVGGGIFTRSGRYLSVEKGDEDSAKAVIRDLPLHLFQKIDQL